jgi:hypothetical protein
MRDLAKQPLLHFLLFGALLAGLAHLVSGGSAMEDARTLRITADDVARLRTEWTARWNRPPTEEELDGLVRGHVRERVLHQEALRLGLDRDEPIVRRVLVQKLERLTSDLIELSLAPTDRALEAYFGENSERYRPESLITMTQVYVDGGGTADGGAARAEALVEELRSLGEAAATRADRYGDRLMLDPRHSRQTGQRIAALFGSDFAESVFALAPGRWHGPVRSGYGLHAVFVHELEEFPLPTLDAVRELVRQDWIDDHRRRIGETYYENLLAGYEVIIEDDAERGAATSGGGP